MGMPIRMGLVDDHKVVSAGVPASLAGLVELSKDSVLVTSLDELLEHDHFDVVLLDVLLPDNPVPEDNVTRLVERGWNTLLYTQVSSHPVIGRCLQAGALGVVGKREDDMTVLAEAVLIVAAGEPYLNADWALAMEAVDRRWTPDLTPREKQVLKLYAAGLPLKSVARQVSIAEETAREYLTRIRRKYEEVGRPAVTKTDLYVRAIQDGHLPNPAEL